MTVEEASAAGFADEYYAQLQDVFAKQGLRPTYGVDRVRELIRCVHPTGRLLLVRALGPEGEPIASGIFPAMNRTAYFWGGASWRSHQILRPNEAIFWFAMRDWKARGMSAVTTFVSSENHEDMLVLKELIDAGKIAPVIDRRYPLAEAPEAIRYVEQGQARGKVVITV